MTLSVQLNAAGVALSAPARWRNRRRMRALERRVHHPDPVAVLVLRRGAGGGEPPADRRLPHGSPGSTW